MKNFSSVGCSDLGLVLAAGANVDRSIDLMTEWQRAVAAAAANSLLGCQLLGGNYRTTRANESVA